MKLVEFGDATDWGNGALLWRATAIRVKFCSPVELPIFLLWMSGLVKGKAGVIRFKLKRQLIKIDQGSFIESHLKMEKSAGLFRLASTRWFSILFSSLNLRNGIIEGYIM